MSSSTSVWWNHHNKLIRADEHLNTLRGYDIRLREPDPDRTRSKVKPLNDGFLYLHYMKAPKLTEERDLRWFGIVLGDFVHNLSSLLDQLVFTLIERNMGKPPDWETSFPIFTTEDQWSDEIAHTRRHVGRRSHDPFNRIYGVPSSAGTIIEQLQPYNRRKREEPLARLHQLWNADKHKVVHAAAVTAPDITPVVDLNVKEHSVRLREVDYDPGIQLDRETYKEVLRIKISKAQARWLEQGEGYVTVATAPLQIAFSEWRLKVADLEEIYDAVNELLFWISELFPAKQDDHSGHPPPGWA